ncbi:MAG: nucleotidyltransferase domain-containing protein [Bacteroidota bacterium]
MNIITKNTNSISKICESHKVRTLFVFGSVLTEKFNKNSDIDFIVDFLDVDLYNYANNYFELKKALEKTLKHEVDLLEEKAVKNPYLRSSIDSTKQIIYG